MIRRVKDLRELSAKNNQVAQKIEPAQGERCMESNQETGQANGSRFSIADLISLEEEASALEKSIEDSTNALDLIKSRQKKALDFLETYANKIIYYVCSSVQKITGTSCAFSVSKKNTKDTDCYVCSLYVTKNLSFRGAFFPEDKFDGLALGLDSCGRTIVAAILDLYYQFRMKTGNSIEDLNDANNLNHRLLEESIAKIEIFPVYLSGEDILGRNDKIFDKALLPVTRLATNKFRVDVLDL